MNIILGIKIAGLILALGSIRPAAAQRDQRDDKKAGPRGQSEHQQRDAQPRQPRQENSRAEQSRQQPRREQGARERQPSQQPARDQGASRQRSPQRQPQRQQNTRGPEPPRQRTRDQAKAWQQQRGWAQKGGWQGHNSWEQNRARNWQNEHRTWRQRGGYGGYYIPQDRFRLSFGRAHPFRIRSRPTIFMGYPRFDYGGFSFMLVDPWPESWSPDWYDTQDLYIDYMDDGYYLYDHRRPGLGLAITIVL